MNQLRGIMRQILKFNYSQLVGNNIDITGSLIKCIFEIIYNENQVKNLFVEDDMNVSIVNVMSA